MESIDQVWIFVAIALSAGVVVGALLQKKFNSGAGDADRLRSELEQARSEMEQYKTSVNEHFSKTSDLVNELTQDYVKVYRHLSEGAHALSDSPEFKQVLEQSHGKVLISVDEKPAGEDPSVVETAEPAVAEPAADAAESPAEDVAEPAAEGAETRADGDAEAAESTPEAAANSEEAVPDDGAAAQIDVDKATDTELAASERNRKDPIFGDSEQVSGEDPAIDPEPKAGADKDTETSKKD